MTDMTFEKQRVISMWALAACLVAAAAGWMFMRFGQAWSVADLPESDNISRIVPAYLIAEIMMIPIVGKVADKIGCRRALFIGSVIFIIGSMLSIVTPSVELLIVFRFIQGIGAGFLLILPFVAVGKYYPRESRGKCNELMTASFALGSLFGTSVGYFFTDLINWRAGFVVLAVIVLIGTMVAWKFLPEQEGTGERLDTFNLILVTALFGISAYYTQTVNSDFKIFSPISICFLAVIVVLFIAVMVQSRKSFNPTIPTGVSIFEKKLIFLMFMFSMCGLGLIQYLFKMYLTTYEFDVYKGSFNFILLLLGAAIPSILGSRKVLKTGVRPWILIGGIVVAITLILMYLFGKEGELQFGILMALFGFGLGFIVTQIIVSTQYVVDSDSMGQHMANLLGVRMVGIVAGNAIVGGVIEGIQNGKATSTIDLSSASDLFHEIGSTLLSDFHFATEALSDGLFTTILVMAVITVLLVILAYTLGKDDKLPNQTIQSDESECDPEE